MPDSTLRLTSRQWMDIAEDLWSKDDEHGAAVAAQLANAAAQVEAVERQALWRDDDYARLEHRRAEDREHDLAVIATQRDAAVAIEKARYAAFEDMVHESRKDGQQ